MAKASRIELIPKKTLIVMSVFYIALILLLVATVLYLKMMISDFAHTDFPLLERSAINVRLASGIIDKIEQINKRPKETSLVTQYLDKKEIFLENLADYIILLQRETSLTINQKAIDHFFADQSIFLRYLKNDRHLLAHQLHRSTKYKKNIDSFLIAIGDTAEKLSEKRDHSLIQINKMINMIIALAALCIVFILATTNRLFLSYKHNLNRKKELENDLEKERSQKVQKSRLSAMGEMAAGVAHEINNPLAIINGHLFGLKKQLKVLKVDNNAIIEEKIEKIKLTVMRISKIIRGLKTFSRDGNQDDFNNYSLKELLEEVQEFSQNILTQNKITFSVHNNTNDDRIICQYVQICQVLFNLINNSKDAIIDIENKWIKLYINNDDQNFYFTITDSGAGIEKDLAKKIFNPFFTSKEVGKGTGLGLSISKEIIEFHGGELKLNQKSKNTQFTITLPKSKKKMTTVSEGKKDEKYSRCG